MSNVIPFQKDEKLRMNKISYCAGCHRKITGRYKEITLPYPNRIEYIALCAKCVLLSHKHGVNV